MRFIDRFAPDANHLIINLENGTGHVQAAARVESDIKESSPNSKVVKKEIFKTLYGDWIGSTINNRFNSMLRNEDIRGINEGLNYQWINDFVLAPIAFCRFVHILLFDDICNVITTQSASLQSIIRAAQVVNGLRHLFGSSRPEIRVTMIMTDLPTVDAKNFLPSMRTLSASEKKIFTLVTTNPLLKDEASEEEFWEKNAGLSLRQGEVIYDALPIKKAFIRLESQKEPITQVSLRIGSPEEASQIQECIGEPLALESDNSKFSLNIEEKDSVTFLMLGGQACVEATKKYAQKIMEIERKEAKAEPHYLFVFCGRNDGEDTLFKQLHRLVKEARAKGDYPQNLKIVPLSFQTDEEVAPILARSNRSITKAGGLTAMEVNTLARNKVFIHSSYHDGDPAEASEETLLRAGMSVWEVGNACYLKHSKGAKIVTPETFS